MSTMLYSVKLWPLSVLEKMLEAA